MVYTLFTSELQVIADLGHILLTLLHHTEATHRARMGSFHALETCLLELHWMKGRYFVARRKQIENVEKFSEHQGKLAI